MRKNIFVEFESLVKDMDIPPERKAGNPANGIWFLCNASPNNQGHRLYGKARELARQLSQL
jgi:hypothetical protein